MSSFTRSSASWEFLNKAEVDRVDPILRISSILNFSVKCYSCEISQNFPFAKYNPRKISLLLLSAEFNLRVNKEKKSEK